MGYFVVSMTMKPASSVELDGLKKPKRENATRDPSPESLQVASERFI